MLKCIATQACGILRSITEKPKAVLYVINMLKEENKDYLHLQKWLDNYKFSKPNTPSTYQINSICSNVKKGKNFYFVELMCTNFPKIRIPIKPTKVDNKWNNKGKRLNGVLLCNNRIDFCYEMEAEYKEEGIKLGADQGQLTCLSLSDEQVTKINKDGYDLNIILNILKRKKKGSKGFKRVQEHRKNYINWSINQLNLEGVKEIGLEKIKGIRKGEICSRKRSHWTYTLIKEKVVRFAQENKVCVNEQKSFYRSQRCSCCGLVRKSNRQGKVYVCSGCGYVGDADINAAKNHAIDLPDVSGLWYSKQKLNINGFYWLENGIFGLDSKELTVRACANKR